MEKILRKVLFPAVAAVALSLAVAASAFAELVPAKDTYTVSFTADKKMDSNFKTADVYNQASGLQPGDYTDIVMNLKNDNSQTVDWYMTNKVLKSLEDTRDESALAGGAYTYILTYKNSTTGAERTLFSSDTVGGEDVSNWGEGLHEATGALQDWLYLDTFKKDEGGVLTLRVALDGETQGNDYQDTLAELQMNFAVELNLADENGGDQPTGGGESNVVRRTDGGDEGGSNTTRSGGGSSSSTTRRSSDTSSGSSTQVVRTGDYTSTVPYLVAAGVSGIFFLLLAIYSLRERKRQRGGAA